MDMTCPNCCPNCHTRVPVLLESQVVTTSKPTTEFPAGSRVVLETTEQLNAAVQEFLGHARVVRLVPPSEASRCPRRSLSVIAAELRLAQQRKQQAEELWKVADKAARQANHEMVAQLHQVQQLRNELQRTAEGSRC
jgi:hypothetical protein